MIENSGRPHAVDALVFDAYGTLFDVQSVASTAEALFPGRGAALAQLWRSKQLEYSWLQSLMQSPRQPREDFAAVTAHALSYAAEALALAAARARQASHARRLSRPVAVLRRRADAGGAGAAPATDPVQRYACNARAARCGDGPRASSRRHTVGRRCRRLQAEPACLSACRRRTRIVRRSASASCRRTPGTRSAPRHLDSRCSGSTARAPRSIATGRRRIA